MKKVLVAYFSAAGTTRQMAEFIAEGARFSGQQVSTRNIEDIRDASELAGYDGYIFGSPTYSLDLPGPMKTFLLLAEKARLGGKLGGAFGSYTHDVGYQHDAHAPAIIMETLQSSAKMIPFELGALTLNEELLKTKEGLKACQDYGRVFGETLGE
ncbi:MAG: nitric oxide synthase [Dehalococcoidia bacterium]|nr:MAG: nitric oxide synthase [Dehalococcoidia bacterium]